MVGEIMNFVELKKHIISEKHFCCYNLVGDDNFLVDSSINMFFNYIANNNEFNIATLSSDDIDANKLSVALNTTSFFGGTKVVLVKYLDTAKNKTVVNFVADYLAKNPNDMAVLVVTSKEPMFAEKTAKNLADKFVVVNCNRLDSTMLYVWINQALKEKNATMEQGAKAKLIDYTNGYLSKISKELEKLINYANGREITTSDVELLVTKDLEFSVFELTENLGRGNSAKTFEILNQMMSDKKSAPSVFAMIQNYFRRMFLSSISAGTNSQIASLLGVKEYAIKKAKEVASLFSKSNLKAIVDQCAELDIKIKTSQINYNSAVNYLVLFILNLNKK